MYILEYTQIYTRQIMPYDWAYSECESRGEMVAMKIFSIHSSLILNGCRVAWRVRLARINYFMCKRIPARAQILQF